MSSGQTPSDSHEVKLNKDIVAIDWDEMTRPEDYVSWDPDLIAAANVALALGKPLLLTGEPGVGKSEFSSWLAYELGLSGREKFVVKSTTEANDLFYTYDTLGRFHDAQANNLNSGQPGLIPVDPLRYIKYQALGVAILSSNGRKKAIDDGFINDEMTGFIPLAECRTVVLIDEIDKAPRDVPNDILDEIDKMTFSIKELGGIKQQANKTKRPVVVITSNSERDLPEAFLRRCIYYHIPFPENDADLKKILLGRLRKRMAETDPLLADAQKMLKFLREDNIPFLRKPGLAEVLDWLYELSRDSNHQTLRLCELAGDYAYITAKTTLLKHSEDQKKLTKENWMDWLAKAGLSNGYRKD